MGLLGCCQIKDLQLRCRGDKSDLKTVMSDVAMRDVVMMRRCGDGRDGRDGEMWDERDGRDGMW